MSRASIGLSDELQAYVASHTTPPTDVERRLIRRTAELGDAAGMQIAPEQGVFLSMLTTLVRPRLAVEVGTFTGYSAMAIASRLTDDGRLICCDVSENWTAIARQHWDAAGITDRIDLRIGPAIETLRAFPADTVVDLVFIDADKAGYVDYYEALLPMLSERGLICVDNTLWGGSVLDDADRSTDTEAIRRFNAHVAADERTNQVIVPIGDGLTIIEHRG